LDAAKALKQFKRRIPNTCRRLSDGAFGYRLAREKKFRRRFIYEVHAMLYEDKNPKQAVRDLISRAFKAEGLTT